mmetsp:Transcript_12796/g.26127  ORF Transcript_12796/g.26127 Transcript_12796/m.26127 type:complete len:480 (-) Transcript_12796:154-1593(-)
MGNACSCSSEENLNDPPVPLKDKPAKKTSGVAENLASPQGILPPTERAEKSEKAKRSAADEAPGDVDSDGKENVQNKAEEEPRNAIKGNDKKATDGGSEEKGGKRNEDAREDEANQKVVSENGAEREVGVEAKENPEEEEKSAIARQTENEEQLVEEKEEEAAPELGGSVDNGPEKEKEEDNSEEQVTVGNQVQASPATREEDEAEKAQREEEKEEEERERVLMEAQERERKAREEEERLKEEKAAREIKIGERVEALYDGMWFPGDLVSLPDEDEYSRYGVICDVDRKEKHPDKTLVKRIRKPMYDAEKKGEERELSVAGTGESQKNGKLTKLLRANIEEIERLRKLLKEEDERKSEELKLRLEIERDAAGIKVGDRVEAYYNGKWYLGDLVALPRTANDNKENKSKSFHDHPLFRVICDVDKKDSALAGNAQLSKFFFGNNTSADTANVLTNSVCSSTHETKVRRIRRPRGNEIQGA